MRFLVSKDADGRMVVSDADTGAALPWVEAVQVSSEVDLDGRVGKAWLFLGTTAFSSVMTITTPPAVK